MASWLVRSSSDRAVRVRALAGDTVLCSWARHFTLTVHSSQPRGINGYRRIVGENLTNCWGVTCDGLASRPGRVEISSGPMSQLAQKASLLHLLYL